MLVEERAMVTREKERATARRADPSALGFAAFAVTTFLISLYNIVGGGIMPLAAFGILALFYGGAAQFVAGLFEYRRERTFGATFYTSYGAFYLAMAALAWLAMRGAIAASALHLSLAWILLAYAVVTLPLLLQSFWVNATTALTLLALEATEILLVIGYFMGDAAGIGLVAVGGGVGILTAILAWYTSGAALVNSMAGHTVLPVGKAAVKPIDDHHDLAMGRRAA